MLTPLEQAIVTQSTILADSLNLISLGLFTDSVNGVDVFVPGGADSFTNVIDFRQEFQRFKAAPYLIDQYDQVFRYTYTVNAC